MSYRLQGKHEIRTRIFLVHKEDIKQQEYLQISFVCVSTKPNDSCHENGGSDNSIRLGKHFDHSVEKIVNNLTSYLNIPY